MACCLQKKEFFYPLCDRLDIRIGDTLVLQQWPGPRTWHQTTGAVPEGPLPHLRLTVIHSADHAQQDEAKVLRMARRAAAAMARSSRLREAADAQEGEPPAQRQRGRRGATTAQAAATAGSLGGTLQGGLPAEAGAVPSGRGPRVEGVPQAEQQQQ